MRITHKESRLLSTTLHNLLRKYYYFLMNHILFLYSIRVIQFFAFEAEVLEEGTFGIAVTGINAM